MKKQVSFKSLAKTADKPLAEQEKTADSSERVNKLTSEQAQTKDVGHGTEQPAHKAPSHRLVQVAIRMKKRERRELQDLARAQDKTVQEFLMELIADFKTRKGAR